MHNSNSYGTDEVARQVEALRAELRSMAASVTPQQAWPRELGQSFERGLYNVSLSTREASEKLRVALLGGALVLGASMAVTLLILVVCIWRIGGAP